MAMFVIHDRTFQTERPFPSSLLFLVLDVSSGNGEMDCQGAAGSGVGVTAEGLKVEQGCREGGRSRTGRESMVSGSSAAQETSVTAAPSVPALSCSEHPLSWSPRGRHVRAPATVS